MWKSNFPEILINRVSQLLIFSITFNFYKLNNFNRIVDRLVISFYVQNILICKMQKYWLRFIYIYCIFKFSLVEEKDLIQLNYLI